MSEELGRKLQAFSERMITVMKDIHNEEATKSALVMPFFSLLGYDVFNPSEFIPEFVADVGIKQGEKVDYAIRLCGNLEIIVECKVLGAPLAQHASQLFRYYAATDAKFAVLTDGRLYQIYTDLDNKNKMDAEPCAIFDLLNVQSTDIAFIEQLCRDKFNGVQLYNSMETAKYIVSFREFITTLLTKPTDEMLRFIIKNLEDSKKIKLSRQKALEILDLAAYPFLAQAIFDTNATGLLQRLLTCSEKGEESLESEDELDECEQEDSSEQQGTSSDKSKGKKTKVKSWCTQELREMEDAPTGIEVARRAQSYYAIGTYFKDSFVLKKGTVFSSTVSDSFSKMQGVMKIRGLALANCDDLGTLLKDFHASSPSTAASIVSGHGQNGLTFWKTVDTDVTLRTVLGEFAKSKGLDVTD